jgi:hypothetical protein
VQVIVRPALGTEPRILDTEATFPDLMPSCPALSFIVFANKLPHVLGKMFETLQQQLASSLSAGASITSDKPSRWSTYGAPEPVAIVNANSDEDVATTVRYLFPIAFFGLTHLGQALQCQQPSLLGAKRRQRMGQVPRHEGPRLDQPFATQQRHRVS